MDNTDIRLSSNGHSYPQPLAVAWFSARWCAPCKQLAPIIDRIKSAYQDRLHIEKIDVDDQPELAAEFGVRAVPTLVLISRKKVISFTVGATPYSELSQWIDRYLDESGN